MISLKNKLMLQSLSPLAFLTIVRNFSFIFPEGEFASKWSFIEAFTVKNRVLIIVFLLCIVWLVAAVISFIAFKAFKWTDKKQGYDLAWFDEKEEASLNFFMTMIIPLLIDDVGTIQGALTFFSIVLLMCALLNRTKLFYANPVLAILGYHVYEIQFQDNKDFKDKKCIGVTKGNLSDNPGSIEYKAITGNVLYVKEMEE